MLVCYAVTFKLVSSSIDPGVGGSDYLWEVFAGKAPVVTPFGDLLVMPLGRTLGVSGAYPDAPCRPQYRLFNIPAAKPRADGSGAWPGGTRPPLTCSAACAGAIVCGGPDGVLSVLRPGS